MEEMIIELVKDLGFPIAMCLWFMFKTDKSINANTKAITQLSTMLEKQNGRDK